jgi:tetratricopeptide (TPR) repeat protein
MKKSVGLLIAVVLLGGVGCRQTAEPPKKISITTSSEEARAAFLKGRDLAEELRSVEAQALLDQAIQKDPNFATAHLLRAQTSTSRKEFFDHLKAAVAAVDKVSDGEQLCIRAAEADANGDTKASGESYSKLVAAYPGDERAHMLLGVDHYSRQRSDAAIAEFQKAVQLAPNFAPVYNMLGYAYRDVQNDKEAEAAFRKYIELVPNEPNPYDSLGELLLKMGRFNESIESYNKALTLNGQFLSAYRGIAANLMFQDKHKEALEQLKKGFDASRDDGERRGMLRAMAICETDRGELPAALAMLSKESALAEKLDDKLAMAQVSSARADLILNASRIDEAKSEYGRSLELAQQSTAPDQTKKNFTLGNHGELALVAAAKKDFETAKKEAEVMRAGFEALGDPNAIRSVHEVLGIVALREAKYDEAISHLNQADVKAPYTLFQLAKAYAGKKDGQNAKACYEKAANAYTLPDLGYAMVRKAAKKAAGK